MKTRAILAGIVLLCATVIANENVLARHQAFTKEISANPAAATKYLNDKDAEIRRFAIYTLAKNDLEGSIDILKKGCADENEFVRMTAVAAMSQLVEKHPELMKILVNLSKTDKNTQVRQLALKASWPFHRQTTLLRDDKDWDHDVVVAKRFAIPTDKWKFKTDPQIDGHTQNWFGIDFNDNDWRPIKVGHWENQGVLDYDGIAWYRIRFTMPEKMDFTSIEVAFEAVDETAWVWLNGVYLGCHDIGIAGWNKPFALDCRKEAKWGEENILVVRVQDLSAGGGIWKPINIEILK